MRKIRAAVAVAAALALVPLSSGTAQAQFSGKPGMIAFVRGGDVHIAAANGTGVKRLTATAAVESTPKWSPDGKTIAFVRGGYIWTLPAAGGAATRRVEGTAPSWSPDGTHLAYAGVDRDSFIEEQGEQVPCGAFPTINTVALSAGSQPRTLVAANAGSACSWGVTWETYGPTTSWSPDGARVLYAFGETDDAEELGWRGTSISETNTWSYGHSRLTEWTKVGDPAHRTPELDYSPNGANYVFATNAGDPNRTGRLWVHNRSGTYKKQASPDKDVRFPVYSPTGKQVLYAQHSRGQQPKLRLVTLPSSTPKTVLTNASEPDWQRMP